MTESKILKNFGGEGGGRGKNKDDRPLDVKGNNPFEDDIPDYMKDSKAGILPQAEPLNAKTIKLADPLIPVFGEAFCCELFSKVWGLRN